MIRFAEERDTSAVRALFDQCFPDESGFNAYFFDRLYRPEQTLLYEQGNTLCAMVQMLPYQLFIGGTEGTATYIYGACTHPEHRRKHFMAQLLEASFEEDRRMRRCASLLIPQEEWLFQFYRPFGYIPVFGLERKIVLQEKAPSTEVQPLGNWCEANELYTKKTISEPCRIIRSEADWKAQLALFQSLGAGAFGLYEKDKLSAYAFVWREKDGYMAQELLAQDARCEALLVQALLRHFGSQQMAYYTVGSGQMLGCLKPYQAAPERGYINLMFN